MIKHLLLVLIKIIGEKAVPLASVTLLIIFTFTVVTSLKLDPIKSKPWEAIIGVLCPLLSLCASFGLLFWVNLSH